MSLDITLLVEGRRVAGMNITHNLGKMAQRAGLYEQLWRAGTCGITTAAQLYDAVEPHARSLAADSRFSEYDDPDNWGTWVQFVPWLYQLLMHCAMFPHATVEFDR